MARSFPPPARLGYRWPAEWEPHEATWVAWPHRRGTWPGAFEPIPGAFSRFVRTLARFEPVHVLAGDGPTYATAVQLVGEVPRVTLHRVPTDDAWCRDYGPTFLTAPREQPPALIDWLYNSWGGKYPPYDHDDAAPRRIAEILDYECFAAPLVLEGGAIDGDGRGTLLTTSRCLLNPNRNPGLTRDDLERTLADYLGIRQVVWLEGGELAGDDTDGHVDQLARFVDERTIVVATESDPHDVNYAPLRRNLELLEKLAPRQSPAWQIVPLPLPSPKYQGDDPDSRLPASYCNFCFVNGGLVVPTFDDLRDEPTLELFQRLVPDRQVVGVPSLELVWGLGSLHCLSQQQPARRIS